MLTLNFSHLQSLKILATAATATVGLLLFMASLVTQTPVNYGETPWEPTSVFQEKIVIEDKHKNRNRPEPKPKPKFSPAPPMVSTNTTQQPFEPVIFDKRAFPTQISGPQVMSEGIWSGGNERTASLTNPVAARYPNIAIERQIEGYVDVIFDITAEGTTTNVRVLEAEPARIFNRNAVKAVKKWKYRPQLESGKAVIVVGVIARVHFELEK